MEFNERVDNTFYLYPTNDTKVIKVMHYLKSQKSAGYDGIRLEIIRRI